MNFYAQGKQTLDCSMSVSLPYPHTDIFTEQLTTDIIIEHKHFQQFPLTRNSFPSILTLPKSEILSINSGPDRAARSCGALPGEVSWDELDFVESDGRG
jgi:hypothetical protein